MQILFLHVFKSVSQCKTKNCYVRQSDFDIVILAQIQFSAKKCY